MPFESCRGRTFAVSKEHPGASPVVNGHCLTANLSEYRCAECDYSLNGVTGDRCPWCGWQIDVDHLLDHARSSAGSQRIVTGVTSACVGILSLVGMWLLWSRGTSLSIYDAITVVAVVGASAGHLLLSAMTIFSPSGWPLRRHEASNILHFVGWMSVVGAIVGASHVLRNSPPGRGFEGVYVNDAMTFFFMAGLFTAPGWSLLVMRFISFQPRGTSSTGRSSVAAAIDNLDGRAPFAVEVFGPFTPDQLDVPTSDAPRRGTPAIEAAIERTWATESALAEHEGRMLFNGRLARLVEMAVKRPRLRLALGTTCYRDFLGTNLHHAATVLREGIEALANPLGTSSTVITSDGYIALGRRSDRVAYHAGMLHAFGGMVESADETPDGTYDVFGSATRELSEELALSEREIIDMVIVGLVRDRAIYQPELLFDATVSLNKAAVADRFHAGLAEGEHTRVEFVLDDPDAVMELLGTSLDVAPVTHGGLLLHGRRVWGADWYQSACTTLYGQLPPQIDRVHDVKASSR